MSDNLTELTEALAHKLHAASGTGVVPLEWHDARSDERNYYRSHARVFIAEHVVPLLAEREAKAWDKGRKARGLDDAANVFGQYPEHVETPNPYRSAVSGEPR